jgi:hypothetical protein
MTMNKNTPVSLALLVPLVTFLGVCQFVHLSWRMGHDEFSLVPVQRWNFGDGFWDAKTTGGRFYDCGPLHYETNAYP